MIKNDQHKNRLELIPSEAIEAMGQALTFGANKYYENSWREGTTWTRWYGACLRHLNAWNKGEDKDPESGLSHLAHAMTCLAVLVSYQETNTGTDNRYIYKTKNKLKDENHLFMKESAILSTEQENARSN